MSGITLLGCSKDTTDPASAPSDQLFWKVSLNWNAITMALDAPYDTVQLTGVPVNASGTVAPGIGTVTYSVKDSNITVSPTGLVTAHYVTNSTQVIASLTVNGVTHRDTATIRVTQHPFAAPFATLSIQPQPDGLDSAKVFVDQYFSINQYNGNIPVYATIATGNPATDTVCDVNNFSCPFLVHWSSSNPDIATLDKNGVLSAIDIGRVTFTVSAYVYGVGKRDSLLFVIGYGHVSGVNVYANKNSLSLSRTVATIGTTGWVVFNNITNWDVVVSLPYQTPTIYNYFTVDPTQMTDTIPAGVNNDAYFFEFDSLGTYTAHIRTLAPAGSGVPSASTDETIIVSSGP